MLVNVITVPVRHGFVEAFVLYVPPGMAEGDHGHRRSSRGRQRGHPHPFGVEFFDLMIELPPNLLLLKGMYDANRSFYLGPGGKVLKIPIRNFCFTSGKLLRRNRAEEGSGVLDQIAAFILEHRQRIFAVFEDEIVEARVGVEGIAEDDIESTGVLPQEALKEPQSAGNLVLARELGFAVENERNALGDEECCHVSVVVLDLDSSGSLNLPLETALALTPVTRMGFVTVEDQGDEPMPRCSEGLVPLEPCVEVRVNGSNRHGVHCCAYASHGVSTGQGSFDPALPERDSLAALQCVEAPQASEGHGEAASSNDDRRDSRVLAIVGDTLQGLGEAADLLGVGEKTSEDGYTSLFRTLS